MDQGYNSSAEEQRQGIDTINDLDRKAQDKTRTEFLNSNKYHLRKYFGILDMEALKQTYFAKFFWRYCEISVDDDECVQSANRFSKSMLKIPKSIEIVSEILVKQELSVCGLFRLNTARSKIDALTGILMTAVKEKIPTDEACRRILADFDIVDISETYKTLFKNLNRPVIPEKMVKLALKINAIDDPADKKLCMKAFVFSLPEMNRKILENCVYVCKIIVEKLKKLKSKQKMNMAGLGVVMMPNLIKPSTGSNDFKAIKDLSDFVCYLFQNFEDFICI